MEDEEKPAARLSERLRNGLRALGPIAIALLVVVAGIAADRTPGRLGLDLLDRAALESSNRTLESTASVFVSARAINALLSTARSFSVGVGLASVSPGQLLDPLDRIIDDFNDWMLDAVTAVAITNLLLIVGHDIGPIWFALFAGMAWLGVHYAGGRRGSDRRGGFATATGRLFRFALALALLFRLGLPAALWASDQCVTAFTTGPYQAALAELRKFGAPVQDFELSIGATPAMAEKVKVAAKAIYDDSRTFIVALGTVAAVFVIRVILLPIVFILLFWRVARLAAGP